jgi:ribosome-associated protein
MVKKNKTESTLLDEIVNGIENVKGEDIQILDLKQIDNTPCDFFII